MARSACSLLALLVAPAAGIRWLGFGEQKLNVPVLRVQRPEENFERFGDGVPGEKLDWVISKAVAEWYPYKVNPSYAAAEAAGGLAVSDKEKEEKDRIWVFGSHNRAGSTMLYKLAELQANRSLVMMCTSFGKFGWAYRWCKKHDPRIWYLSDLTAEHLQNVSQHGRSFRAVNLLRDPIAMVISGYIIHLQVDDTPEELLPIRNMTMADGLAAEADFQFKHGLGEMLELYQHAPRPQTLHVRFEDFALDSVEFDATTERVYNHTFGDLVPDNIMTQFIREAQAMDITRNPRSAIGSMPLDVVERQVSALFAAMPKATLERLKRARETVGYA